jgi:DNA-binding transcriptional regulator/RsmH inhibitor MraZ
MIRTAFSASFALQVDVQGRVALPASWRGAGEAFSLQLVSSPASHIVATVNAAGTPPDSVGRLQIPDDLRRAASIEGETLLVGLIDRFALWSPTAFQAIARTDTKHTVGTLV